MGGGFDKIAVSELWQIRQDFLNWPFESIVHLEELTGGKNLKCREIGVAEDSIPIVQLYIVYTDEDSGELVTRLISKELVDRGAAQWVQHSSVHCAETNVHSAL